MVLVTKRREIGAAADSLGRACGLGERVDVLAQRQWDQGAEIRRDEDREGGAGGPGRLREEDEADDRSGAEDVIRLSFAGDEVVGTRGITVAPLTDGRSKLEVTWELGLSRIPGLAQNLVRNQMVSSQISKATDAALEKIAEAAEGGGEGR